MKQRILFVVLFVAILALAACVTPTPTPTPAPEAPATPAVAVDANAPVKVNSARDIREVLGEKDAVFAALSPDGKYMAYYLPGDRNTPSKFCWYTFDGAGKKCGELTTDQFRGYPYQLQWSPDSSKFAFTENPVEFGNDADIWVLSIADGAIKNLTDDNYVGSWRQPTGTPSSVVDYLPMWNAADGKIYFWRFLSSGEYLQFTTAIYRVDPAGGDPEMVVDVSSAVPTSAPVFQQEQFYLDGPSAMSPDGKNVAALLATADEMGMTTPSLYWFDLAGGAAPKQLMTADAFGAAVPEWNPYPTTPGGLAWTGDGKGVLVIAGSLVDASAPFVVFYYVDPATGTVTPVVDFSDIPSREAYFEPMPGSDIIARWFSPWTGSLSPKGDKVLTINDLTGLMGMMSSNLPPTGALPAISGTTEASTMSTASRSSRSVDGKLTLYGLLLTVTE